MSVKVGDRRVVTLEEWAVLYVLLAIQLAPLLVAAEIYEAGRRSVPPKPLWEA